MNRRLIVSLHDATPFHLERIKKAEALYGELGIAKITYLLVPQYHGKYLASENAEFKAWCRKDRPFQVSWHLHGYFHLENLSERVGQDGTGNGSESHQSQALTGEDAGRTRNFGDGFKRKLFTAGEGEFLALTRESVRAKLRAGEEVFKSCLGREPKGFVAPAWLFNENLIPELRARHFAVTEDQRRIYRCDTGASLESPVVTWATRTFIRKYGSLVVCPILARLWSNAPTLRIAMHPFDFDHPETIAGIRSVLQYALRNREQVFSEDLSAHPEK